jgi:DNA polymerase V
MSNPFIGRDPVPEAIYRIKYNTRIRLPFFSARIPAGFPSPADDYIDRRLDLNELLIKHPSATFFVKVSGDSMTGAGIQSGDTLIVDRAETPLSNSIIIAALDGELTVKRLVIQGNRAFLKAENPGYAPIAIGPESGFEIWGVVIHVIHTVR